MLNSSFFSERLRKSKTWYGNGNWDIAPKGHFKQVFLKQFIVHTFTLQYCSTGN